MDAKKIVTVPGDYKDVWEALGVDRPTDEELAAAKRAVRRQRRRKNEDVDEWAERLGQQFGKMTD